MGNNTFHLGQSVTFTTALNAKIYTVESIDGDKATLSSRVRNGEHFKKVFTEKVSLSLIHDATEKQLLWDRV